LIIAGQYAIIKTVKEGQDLNKNINGGYEMTDSEKLDHLLNEIVAVKKEVRDTRSEMVAVKKEVRDTRLTLENETNKNIQTIAEGHYDLTRKLDEALKVENEKERLLIRVTHLENELRKLKERIEDIA